LHKLTPGNVYSMDSLGVKINVWIRYISQKKKKSTVSKSLLLLSSLHVQSKKNIVDGIERNREVFLFMIANHILKIWKTSISLIRNVILFPFSSIANPSFPLKTDLIFIYSAFVYPLLGCCCSSVNGLGWFECP
jgi:hypothetical protein